MNKTITTYAILIFSACLFSSCSQYRTEIPGINLKASQSAIRNQLLKLTPIGMNYDAAIKVLLKHRKKTVPSLYDSTSKAELVKYHMVPVTNLGAYQGSFAWGNTVVNASWVFDKSGKLTDIQVEKGLSGL